MAPADTFGSAKRKRIEEEDHLADAGLGANKHERRNKKQHNHVFEKLRDVTDSTAGGKGKGPKQGGLRTNGAGSSTSPAAPSKTDEAVAEEEQGHQDVERDEGEPYGEMPSTVKKQAPKMAVKAQTMEASNVAGGLIDPGAETGASTVAADSACSLDLGTDGDTTQTHVRGYMEAAVSDEQTKALESLVLLPPWETNLPITVDPSSKKQKKELRKYGWIRLKGWPNWSTFYWDTDLKDISSVEVMIERFDLLLEVLDLIESDWGALLTKVEKDKHNTFITKIVNDKNKSEARPVPYAQISSIRDKMIYEKGQLEVLERFLDKREGATPESPFLPDLVDTQRAPGDISFYEAGVISKDDIDAVFDLKTVRGAEQAVKWLLAQLDILRQSPLHFQPASPYRYKKSAFLVAVERLRAELVKSIAKLKRKEAAGGGASMRSA